MSQRQREGGRAHHDPLALMVLSARGGRAAPLLLQF